VIALTLILSRIQKITALRTSQQIPMQITMDLNDEAQFSIPQTTSQSLQASAQGTWIRRAVGNKSSNRASSLPGATLPETNNTSGIVNNGRSRPIHTENRASTIESLPIPPAAQLITVMAAKEGR